LRFSLNTFFKSRWKLIAFSFLTLIVLAFISLFGFYYAVKGGVWGEIISDDELLHLRNYRASEVYSADSVLLGRYFVENRTECEYDEVNLAVFELLIATEDVRFYEHTGVDNKSLMRVLFKSIILQQHAGGGSTLSQQLVKNIFGRENHGFLSMPVNKVKEGIIANKLEELYSKKEVLMLYLNTVSFGEDTYGIAAASERFFSCSPKELKIEEAAVLVGMLKAPSHYNPRTKPERSKQRRNVVLAQGAKNNFLSQKEKDSLSRLPIEVHYKKRNTEEGLATYFREYVRKELDTYLTDYKDENGKTYNLYTDGLTIYTSLNSRLQAYAEESVLEHLKGLQKDLDKDLTATFWFDENKKMLERALELRSNGRSEKELSEKESMEVFSYDGDGIQELSTVDSLKYYLTLLKAGFLVEEPESGKVLAWVGGLSYKYFKYDHVLSKRQVGSTFKPIVYASALQRGVSICDFIPNQKIVYEQYDNWSPRNSGGNYEGKYSVIGALTNSVNTVSVRLCMESGIENVMTLAYELGVEDSLPKVPSIALGVGTISLKEMVGVYTAFANQGTYSPMQTILSIKSNKGKELFVSTVNQKEVLDEEVATDVTLMLQSVVDNGTARRLRSKYGFDQGIAGKTGTTQSHSDGWFMGYTKGFVAGVWVGADNPLVRFSGIEKGQGANLALPIWAKFYKKVLADDSLSVDLKYGLERYTELPCELYKEDKFFEKLFRKKERRSNKTGLGRDTEKKGLRGMFRRKRK
jgi:penicillin-binding protein 1A